MENARQGIFTVRKNTVKLINLFIIFNAYAKNTRCTLAEAGLTVWREWSIGRNANTVSYTVRIESLARDSRAIDTRKIIY